MEEEELKDVIFEVRECKNNRAYIIWKKEEKINEEKESTETGENENIF